MRTMTGRTVASIAAGLIVCALAWSQEGGDSVLLRYQWHAGEKVIWKLSAESEGQMVTTDLTKAPPEEKAQQITRHVALPMYQTVEAVDEQGNATVAHRMGVMVIDVETDGGAAQHILIDPDANTMTINGQATPIPEGAAGYFAQHFRMVISPLGEVLGLEPPARREAALDMVGVSLTELAQTTGATQMQFPTEPVRVGYTWSQTREIDLRPAAPGAGDAAGEAPRPPIVVTMLYTLIGFESVRQVECAKIEMVGAMEIREPFRLFDRSGEVDLTVDMGLGHFSLRGFLYFDPKGGCLTRSETQTRGIMHQEIRGQVKAGDQTRDINQIVTTDGFLQRTTLVRQFDASQ